jgi:uncharacterized protein YkwD
MRYVLLLATALATATAPALATPPRVPDLLERRASLEAEILRELNRARAEQGLRPVRSAESLRTAALAHSRAMLRLGFFGHVSADGTSFDDRIRRYYPDRGWSSWSVAETLLSGDPAIHAHEIVAAWLRSPRHREIILAETWREAGIGAVASSFAPRAFRGTATLVVTADFGLRAGRDSRRQ